jgi:hypothetical protein
MSVFDQGGQDVTYKSNAAGSISLDRVNNKESFLGGVVAGPAAGNQKVTGLTRRCDCRHRRPVCIEVFIDVA